MRSRAPYRQRQPTKQSAPDVIAPPEPSEGWEAISLPYRSEIASTTTTGRNPSALLADVDHRNHGGQLKIYQEVDTAIDLIAHRSLLGRDNLLK
jgi:hypothetical protein